MEKSDRTGAVTDPDPAADRPEPEETGERSRLEIPVGQDLKEEYGLGYHDRLRLEVAGNPKWDGEQGRLELYYDEVDAAFRAIQPVSVDDSRQDSPLASEEVLY